MTQNNLGNALSALGERESGTAGLEETVAAYRAALEELTHKSAPFHWEATQNNLKKCDGSRSRKTAMAKFAVRLRFGGKPRTLRRCTCPSGSPCSRG